MCPAVADEVDPGLEIPATERAEVCCLDCCKIARQTLLVDLSLFF